MFVRTRCLRGGTRSEAGTPGNELIKKPMELPPSSLRVRRAGVAAAAAARSRGTRCCLVNHQQICDLIASQGKSPSVKALTHSDFISFTSRLLLGQPQRPLRLFFFQLNSQIFSITSLQRCFSASVCVWCVCWVCCVCIHPSQQPRVPGRGFTAASPPPPRFSSPSSPCFGEPPLLVIPSFGSTTDMTLIVIINRGRCNSPHLAEPCCKEPPASWLGTRLSLPILSRPIISL